MRVYTIQEIRGGTPENLRVFATQSSAEAAFLGLAVGDAKHGAITSAKGYGITPEQAVRYRFYSAAGGDDDCILCDVEVEG